MSRSMNAVRVVLLTAPCLMIPALFAALSPSEPALAQAADPWAGAQAVTVIMIDDKFLPNQLVLHSGQPYQLRLENHGKEMHEFTAPEFFRAATLRDKRVLGNGGAEVVVQSGKSADIFLMPGKPGHYPLSCADHDWDGMIGGITVD